MNTWIILDVSYLCYRNHYALRELSYRDVKSGVVYGLFRDVCFLESYFGSNSFAFCFDSGKSNRKKILSTYKSNRPHRDNSPEYSPQAEETRNEVQRQIRLLRDDYLPRLGYRNVFWQDGYEADDVIASIVRNTSPERCVVVSADKDLYQLLSPGVVLFKSSGRVIYGEIDFAKEWKIHPSRWPEIKAISGCVSDNIPGCPRAGEITAAKFLRGELKQGSDSWNRVRDWMNTPLYQRNLKLVRLPFDGTADFRAEAHSPVTNESWSSVMSELGIKSLDRTQNRHRQRTLYEESF